MPGYGGAGAEPYRHFLEEGLLLIEMKVDIRGAGVSEGEHDEALGLGGKDVGCDLDN